MQLQAAYREQNQENFKKNDEISAFGRTKKVDGTCFVSIAVVIVKKGTG